MSLQTQLTSLTQAIAADIKALNSNQGALENLTTTDKSSLVNAIIELKSLIGAVDLTALISDTTTASTTKTWSITKITAQIDAAVSALVDSAPTALNTLNELAVAIAADETGIAALTTAIGNRVQFDAAQSLTTVQQQQACANIGVGDPTTNFVTIYTTAKA